MKTSLLIYVATASISLSPALANDATPPLNSFEAKLNKAFESRDLQLLNTEFDFEGVPQAFIDEGIYRW